MGDSQIILNRIGTGVPVCTVELQVLCIVGGYVSLLSNIIL